MLALAVALHSINQVRWLVQEGCRLQHEAPLSETLVVSLPIREVKVLPQAGIPVASLVKFRMVNKATTAMPKTPLGVCR
jgi:hypothetical protein